MKFKIGDKVYARFAHRVEEGQIVGIKESKFFKWVTERKYLIKFDYYRYSDERSEDEIWLKDN